MREYPWDWILIGLAVALVIGFAWQGVGRCEGACVDNTPPKCLAMQGRCE